MTKKTLILGAKLGGFSLLLSPVLLAVLTVVIQIVLQFFLFGESLTTGKGPGPTENFACFIPGSGWGNCDLTGFFLNLVFLFFFAFPSYFFALLSPFLESKLELTGLLGSLGILIVLMYTALTMELKYLTRVKVNITKRLHTLLVLVGALVVLIGVLWPFREEIVDILKV